MKKELSPSMMCCDFLNLKEQIDIFEKQKIEYLHIDVMDGSFVPNYTLGTDFVKKLHKATNIPLDLHLMIDRPEDKIEWFDLNPNDVVSVHFEATNHLQRTIQRIKDKGAKAMVAINPATPVSMIEDILDDIYGVLIMTVNPGYAGQRLIPNCINKIAKTRKFLDGHNKREILIEVDGNVSFESAKLMCDAGADIFVAGTSSLFKDGSLESNIIKFRKEVFENK
jgi:ribulose-phosphate 3-epimerase